MYVYISCLSSQDEGPDCRSKNEIYANEIGVRVHSWVGEEKGRTRLPALEMRSLFSLQLENF